MWDKLELVIQVSTGIGALVHGVTLWFRRHHIPLYGNFGVTLMLLGAAMLGKSHTQYAETYGQPLVWWFDHMFALAIAMIPITIAILVEALLRKHMRFWAKLMFLVASVVFGVMALTPLGSGNATWEAVLSVYLVVALSGLVLRIFLAWLRASPGPLRGVYGAMVLVGVITPFFIATDPAHAMGWHVPRLSWVPVALLTYFSGYSLYAVGQYRVRRGLRELGGVFAVVALALTAIVPIAGLTGEQAAAVGAVLVMGYMLSQPARLAYEAVRARRKNVLFDRLRTLPTTSVEAISEALAGWPECARVVPVTLEQLDAPERAGVGSYFAVFGGVADRALLRRQVVLQGTVRRHALAAEELLFLMDNHDVDFLVWVGRDAIGVSFEFGLDTGVYKNLLGVLAIIAELVGRRDV